MLHVAHPTYQLCLWPRAADFASASAVGESHYGLLLVSEPRETDIMQRPQRDQNTPIFDLAMFMCTAVVNVVVAVASAYLISYRNLRRCIFSIGFFTNLRLLLGIGLTVVVQLLFTYALMMNRFLHSAPIDASVWLCILGVAARAFMLVEIEKKICCSR